MNDLKYKLLLVISTNTHQSTYLKLPACFSYNLQKSLEFFSVVLFSVPLDKPTTFSTPIETVRLKHTSKKKQLKTYITNRSFIITNKYSIPNVFYQQWEEGKMHKNTNNYQKIF